MNKNTIVMATMAMAVVGGTVQSCATIATSSIGIAIIKQVLLGGISTGVSIFKDKDAFLSNALIEKAMPTSLVKINSMLEKVSPQLVAKEKDYIAQAAAYTATVSEPILKNAVNSLNAQDMDRIMNGTTATQILREKSSQQLVAAILPKVDEKLNQFGIVKTINSALSGTNLLNSILGGQSSDASQQSGRLSQFATEQMVNGMFSIIEKHEKENKNSILGAFNKK
ncbi:MAG: DUF4197 family protein [Bacteroidetes bacterium]|nr:DUF4197 family protein [Bacteroidota bacterium]